MYWKWLLILYLIGAFVFFLDIAHTAKFKDLFKDKYGFISILILIPFLFLWPLQLVSLIPTRIKITWHKKDKK